ncbi:hypothetical protein Cgig2_030104 [Carnegiea gigantea]|uniref:Sodium/calcium exchanger membrane region domain-containing protein n=1 Tax=Carnegiea gigantea TaxID=171969 RepID=A0A9Q1JSV8_9CARY|nr:hypothetical protein Cgig2_030104 [Carnegiea gigantea]
MVMFRIMKKEKEAREDFVHHDRFVQQIPGTSLKVTNDINGYVQNGEKTPKDPQICDDIFAHKGDMSPCDYLIAHPDCNSGGFLHYMKFLYCDCKNYLFFGYFVLGAWLVILFYLLGSTASDYFCCSLEKLSNLLKMSPTVAGVTLLPLGNGAPDVFASIAAFVGNGSGDVGLNGILGGAVFVTCIVVGVVSLCVAKKRVQIDRKSFITDICFFLFTMGVLTLILVVGKINIWGAMAFVSIYLLYAFSIAIDQMLQNNGQILKLNGWTPLLPVAGSFFSSSGDQEEDKSMNVSLLNSETEDDPPDLSPKLPQWVWNSNVAIYSDYIKVSLQDSPTPLRGWAEETATVEGPSFSFADLWSILEMPLVVPRRLTIPIVEEDRWSKFYAIASATLAPVVLAFLWNTQEDVSPSSRKFAYFVGVGVGLTLGLLAFIYTSSEHPPRRFLFPWVFGGFFMSIIWFYLVANELVSLLVSFGTILGINPSILALTVLAWGNSMGDLMANTAVAMNQRDGVQVAMSGSYAGPMFNTLIGLGVSLLLKAWSTGSEPYVVARDSTLFITMGFLATGLVWALVVLPLSDMHPNRTLGVGLIAIYLVFLGLRVGSAMGMGSLGGTVIKLL